MRVLEKRMDAAHRDFLDRGGKVDGCEEMLISGIDSMPPATRKVTNSLLMILHKSLLEALAQIERLERENARMANEYKMFQDAVK